MKCPVCDENLREIDKYGVHIDICPGCKGMWLDRGELEKIIDYAVTKGSSPVPESEPKPFSPRGFERHEHSYEYADNHHEHGHHGKHERHEYDHYGHKKKKSWLSNLGDLFGD
ncbi:MAG: zf-TFIIB domain-containing protein [Thermodesulfobacteriota bacterium]|jgi:Zn-finger nucleic acid-binding protein|nr:MAG: zf-TFIIB domain-containing protein [Thermodesulfobacteriota bacterium]